MRGGQTDQPQKGKKQGEPDPLKQKENKRVDKVRKMAQKYKEEMESRKQEMQNRRQYDHSDPNVYYKFAKKEINQAEAGQVLPVPEIPKVQIKDLHLAPEIDYFDQPVKKQKNFIRLKDQIKDPKEEMFNTGPYTPDFMLKQNMNPFSKFCKKRGGAQSADAYNMIDSESDSEKSIEEKKEEQGPMLFDNDSDPPREEDPKQYTYRKNPPANMTQEQKQKRCWMRLVSLDIKDPDYWSHVSGYNQEIAEAMSRTGAPEMEPIVATQIQRQVMRMFLKRMKKQMQIQKKNIDYYKTIPGLLEYCFDQRLCHPVRPLKLLMQERRKEFCRIFRDWFDYDEKEVYTQAQQAQYSASLNKFTDQTIVQKLKPIIGSDWGALEVAEISQNDFQAAIQCSLKSTQQEVLQETQLLVLTVWEEQNVENIEPWQEQMFLYRWYRKYESYYIRLRLQAEEKFLEIYTLSMKHLCPSLFKLLVKNVPFVRKLIEKYPAQRLKPRNLPKKVKEYNYIKIIQV